jgi:tetratricopeptide (TPR) repeat protein
MKRLFYLFLLSSILVSFDKSVPKLTQTQVDVINGKAPSAIDVNQKPEAQVKTDTVKAALIRAQSLFKEGKTEEASKIYTSIMESYPDNREAVQGWLIANMKRTPTGEEEAIKSLEDLGKLYPKNTGIIFFKAFLEAEYGHNEEALIDIDKLIKIQPDTALNYIGKGQTLYSMEKYEESFKAFDMATSMDPKRPDVWGMKAGALAKMGKFDDAIVSANKGLELAPDNPTDIYNRACIYSLKGDKANALADLKKAISMNPSFREYATKDEDFKSLWDDEDFKKLTI